MMCPFFGIKGVVIVGYSMIEMIDNRLDQLFPQRDLYTFSPFSVEDLRDNIIMFIIDYYQTWGSSAIIRIHHWVI